LIDSTHALNDDRSSSKEDRHFSSRHDDARKTPKLDDRVTMYTRHTIVFREHPSVSPPPRPTPSSFPSVIRPSIMRRCEIEKLYAAAVARLSRCSTVKVPMLYSVSKTAVRKPKAYAVTGLSFVFFYMNLRKIVTKQELLQFLRTHGCCKDTMPQPRHFGMQNGIYFLVNGSYHPVRRRSLGPGEYCLYSIARCHPSFAKVGAVERRKLVGASAFESMKKKFDSRCGVCGSLEGAKNFKNKTLVTRLEMGHCDPRLPLTRPKNCIPMCQYCNRTYKDKWVFDHKGMIKCSCVR